MTTTFFVGDLQEKQMDQICVIYWSGNFFIIVWLNHNLYVSIPRTTIGVPSQWHSTNKINNQMVVATGPAHSPSRIATPWISTPVYSQSSLTQKSVSHSFPKKCSQSVFWSNWLKILPGALPVDPARVKSTVHVFWVSYNLAVFTFYNRF